VTTWLTTTAAVDRGVTGPDLIHGAGELILPFLGPSPTYRPDAAIRVGQGPYQGNGIRNTNGNNQAVVSSVPPGTVRYTIWVTNDGDEPERINIVGPRSAHGFTIRYGGSAAVTQRVIAGTYFTPVLAPGISRTLAFTVTVPRSAPPSTGITALVAAYSNSDFVTHDVVKFTVRRR
jgi:hypothetical protein